MSNKLELLKKLKKDILNGTSYSVDFLLSPEIEKSLSKNGIKIRRVFAPLLRKIYLTQTKYKLIKENKNHKIKTTKGKIFVVNHRQSDDIVLGANAIGESGYFVFGNKYLALDTTNGLGLWAYGMILLDRDNPENRKKTYEKMKYVIEHGGNIIIYPEGYWNLDDYKGASQFDLRKIDFNKINYYKGNITEYFEMIHKTEFKHGDEIDGYFFLPCLFEADYCPDGHADYLVFRYEGELYLLTLL